MPKTSEGFKEKFVSFLEEIAGLDETFVVASLEALHVKKCFQKKDLKNFLPRLSENAKIKILENTLGAMHYKTSARVIAESLSQDMLTRVSLSKASPKSLEWVYAYCALRSKEVLVKDFGHGFSRPSLRSKI